MFGVAALLAPIDFVQGTDWGQDRRSELARFERDLRSGIPADLLAARYASTLGVTPPGELKSQLEAMHAAGIGEFRWLVPSVVMRQQAP